MAGRGGAGPGPAGRGGSGLGEERGSAVLGLAWLDRAGSVGVWDS